MISLKKLSFLLVILSNFLTAETFEDLLQQERRPTIAEVSNALALQPNSDILRLSDHWNQMFRKVGKDLPKLIAMLEGLVPGARYFALGRDVVNAADVLEAYFHSIGQADRVGRIPLSRESFPLTQSDIESVLEGAGMRFDELGVRPQIIFDVTRLGLKSQSTQVLRAAFQRGINQGISAEDLAGKLLVASTLCGQYYYLSTREQFVLDQRQLITTYGYPAIPLNISLAAPWKNNNAWHKRFGSLHQGKSGFLEGTPGKAAGLELKKQILATQARLILTVRDSKIVEEVKAQAREIGYEYDPGEKHVPLKSIPPEEQERLLLESLKERLEKLVAKLPLKPEQTGYYSTNGQIMVKWLEDVLGVKQRNALCLLFIKKVLEAHSNGKIRDRDLRRLIARAMGKMNVPDDILLERFGELYQQSSLLQQLFKEKRGVFLESKQKDSADVAATFGYLSTKFDCANVLADEDLPEVVGLS